MKRILTVALVVAALAAAAVAADKVDLKKAPLEDLLAAAEDAIRADDAKAAEKYLEAAEKRFPDASEVALFRLGWLYMEKKGDEALAMADKWLAKHPDDEDFARAKLGILLELKRDDDALAVTDDWLAKHPDDQGWLYTKIDMLLKLERVDEALALVDAYGAAHPDDTQWPLYKADLLNGLKRYDEAIKVYEAQVAAGNADEETYFALADLYMRLEKPDYAKAIAAYEAGFAKVAPNEDAYPGELYNLGCAYARAGQKDKAVASVKRALAAQPLLVRDAEGDEDLAPLAGDKEFQKIMADAGALADQQELQNMTVKPGEAAPAFTLEALDGKKYALADFKGQYVVLNLWATWCGPCRREIPEIIAFCRDHQGEVTVVSISVDNEQADLAGFVQEQGMNYLVMKDDGAAAAQYLGAEGGIPQTYFIDKDGVVRGHIYGSAERKTFDQKLAKLLAPKP